MHKQKFVPERFVRAVVLHVIKNMRAPVSSPDIPLILGIHGPPGHGKTYQTNSVLDTVGVQPFYVSGSQLEDPDAAVPRNAIWAKYRAASAAMQKSGGTLAVLVISDIDTGVGAWGALTQYTVNRQIVFGCLMDLTDNPSRCPSPEGQGRHNPSDERCLRVPIIVTGNDFTTLHSPLTRLGRMTLFEWKMSPEEKLTVIKTNIFPELASRDCEYLFNALEKAHWKALKKIAPLSLYSALKAEIEDDTLWTALQKSETQGLTAFLASGQPPSAEKANVKELIRIGNTLISAQQISGHL